MWAYLYLTIGLLHPKMPEVMLVNYSNAITQQAETLQVDPLLFVAIIEHESRFDPRAISQDTFDMGLMQVRHKYYGGKQEWLLDGVTNIKAGATIIRKSIEFCRKLLKREPTTQEWLSVYQGSIPSCKPTNLTKQVDNYAVCLQQDLSNVKDCQFN
jgi:Transglycosylase SLT domain